MYNPKGRSSVLVLQDRFGSPGVNWVIWLLEGQINTKLHRYVKALFGFRQFRCVVLLNSNIHRECTLQFTVVMVDDFTLCIHVRAVQLFTFVQVQSFMDCH